jgi:O-antigen/teichoic acid export membrane protein
MRYSWRKVAKVGTSIVDQAWLSGISLLISLVFARELEKDEFGLYVLLFNTSLLFQGIAGALLAAPYTTLHPRKQGRHQIGIVEFFTLGTLYFAAGVALVAMLGYLLVAAFSQDPLMSLAAGFGFAICIAGSVSKENLRIYHYSQNDPVSALRGNIFYGVLLLCSIALLIQSSAASAGGILLAIGVCSAAVSVPRLYNPVTKADSTPSLILDTPTVPKRTILNEYWACGRWAALGSLVTFLTCNTYPYLAASSFSKSEVADISVARLLSMPIALIGAAWFNLMRPRLSQWSANNQHELLDLTVRNSVAAATALSVLVGIAICFSGDLIRILFGAKYANLRLLTLLWTAQTGLAFIKGIYAATLMTGDSGFKDLSQIGIISLVATVVVMIIAIMTPYPESIVLALVILEGLQIVLIRRKRYHMQTLRCQVSN